MAQNHRTEKFTKIKVMCKHLYTDILQRKFYTNSNDIKTILFKNKTILKTCTHFMLGKYEILEPKVSYIMASMMMKDNGDRNR